MFIFALIYAFCPLIPAIAIAMWSGILFKSYDPSAHGRVREIAARCLGLFLVVPLFVLYFVELALMTVVFYPALYLAFLVGFVASLILVCGGLGLWLFILSKGWTVETGRQSVDAFLLKSWRLTAICSAVAVVPVILLPITTARLY